MALRITFVFFLCLTSLAAQGNPLTAKRPRRALYRNDRKRKVPVRSCAPVASVKLQYLEANSLDCFGNALQKPGDSFSLVKGDNPLTGPFYIEGAQPGDTLIVTFSICRWMASKASVRSDPLGAANATHYTPIIETKPLPEKMWFYPIDAEKNTATFQALDSNFKVSFPLHPFLGCIGVAPANGEARSSIVPAEFGGNMDAPEVSKGNTLYLPVNVAGALFYFGDGHAAMVMAK